MRKARSNQHTSPGRDFSLPRAKILRGRKNFQRLFEQEADTVRNRYVSLRFRTYGTAETGCLMGFIVKKKLGKAVKRNHVRRLLKEAYRLNQHRLTEAVQSSNIGFHGVLMANTIELDFNQAEQSVIELLSSVRRRILSTTDSDL